MIETYEDIQYALTVLGDVLTFTSTVTPLGIAVFDTFYDDTGNLSNSQVEALEFNYMVSTQDFLAVTSTVGTTFTSDDKVYKYTYRIAREPLILGSGWTKLPVNRIKKELL